jgi:oligoribonuclease (3'-5' exoribonuclease)
MTTASSYITKAQIAMWTSHQTQTTLPFWTKNKKNKSSLLKKTTASNTSNKDPELKNLLEFVFQSLMKTNQSACGNLSTIAPIKITNRKKK